MEKASADALAFFMPRFALEDEQTQGIVCQKRCC
jgi:hypothetical protein